MATGLGALTGSIINFLINRYWSFQATRENVGLQAGKYVLVSGGSLCLNVFGVYLVTELTQFHYAVSVLLVSLFVGLFFNYPLQHHFVYREFRFLSAVLAGKELHAENSAENQNPNTHSRSQKQEALPTGETASSSRSAAVRTNGRNCRQNRASQHRD